MDFTITVLHSLGLALPCMPPMTTVVFVDWLLVMKWLIILTVGGTDNNNVSDQQWIRVEWVTSCVAHVL
jgi:hypothetical protein